MSPSFDKRAERRVPACSQRRARAQPDRQLQHRLLALTPPGTGAVLWPFTGAPCDPNGAGAPPLEARNGTEPGQSQRPGEDGGACPKTALFTLRSPPATHHTLAMCQHRPDLRCVAARQGVEELR